MSNEVVVSVIMPVYNSDKFLSLAVGSILNQTFSDFEFLIFNDGSTDSSAEILEGYRIDPRVKVFNYSENKGYVARLNEGIRRAQGKYLARMDADDISDLDRLRRQVELLESYPQVGLCGSWYQMIGARDTIVEISTSHDDLKIGLILNSTFGHPCVMIRTSILRQYHLCYDESYMPAEDFRLWVELSKVTEMRNIPEILLYYRVHNSQISSVKRQLQTEKIQAIRELQISDLLGRTLTIAERNMAQFLFGDDNAVPSERLLPNRSFDWAYGLIVRNRIAGIYPLKKFDRFIVSRVKRLAHYTIFDRSVLSPCASRLLLKGQSPIYRFKFYIKCALNWSTIRNS